MAVVMVVIIVIVIVLMMIMATIDFKSDTIVTKVLTMIRLKVN